LRLFNPRVLFQDTFILELADQKNKDPNRLFHVSIVTFEFPFCGDIKGWMRTDAKEMLYVPKTK
jgi:hypothetical protein